MRTINNLLNRSLVCQTLISCKSAHWKQALLAFLSAGIGSFMPIWGACFLLRLHNLPIIWTDFAKHGELGLYAAAFFAPSIYQILKGIRRDKSPLQAGWVLVGVAGILLAAFIYAGTSPQLATGAGVQFSPIDESFLMHVSGTLLVVALGFGFLTTLFDLFVFDVDLAAVDRANQARLSATITADQSEPVTETAGPPPPNANISGTQLAQEPSSDEELKLRFNADRSEHGDD